MSVEWDGMGGEGRGGGGGEQERLTAVLFPGLFSSSSLGRGWYGEPKKDKIAIVLSWGE